MFFNYRLSRAKHVIENTFGITASSSRVLRRPIIANVKKVSLITQAAAGLHNFLMIKTIGIAQELLLTEIGHLDLQSR